MLVGLGALVAVLQPQVHDLVHRPGSSSVDLLPIWCHARSLDAGEWACGPEVIAKVFRKAVAGPDHGRDGPYYYPPTAGLLLLPTANLAFGKVAVGFRMVSTVALIVAGIALTFAAPVRRRDVALGVGLGVAAVFLSVRVAKGSLLAGQTGPLMVGLTAVALWAAGRARDGWSGAVAAVGVALKLSPILLLAAFVRRRAWVLALGLTLLVLAVPVLLLPGHDDLTAWFTGARDFANRPMREEWPRQEPAWVLVAWRLRYGLGVPTLALAAWTAWRPTDRAAELAMAAVLVAWGGTVMAGAQQTHEALVLLPALGWLLAWPAQQRSPLVPASILSALVLAYMVKLGVASRFSPPNSLAWVSIGYVTWLGCVGRWGWERWTTPPPPHP